MGAAAWASDGSMVVPALVFVKEGWGMVAVYPDGGTDMSKVSYVLPCSGSCCCMCTCICRNHRGPGGPLCRLLAA
jgi:hypothetical protein